MAIAAFTAGDRATGANVATPFRCVECVHARQPFSALSPESSFAEGCL
ncbi:hypothetical protein J8Z82_10355 [Yersinia enterocolitica]|nr:hypothetical protein [Yersinia enterocolitica]MBX9485971.1 hypothetical protein [Yersinia enterocolitica]MBX9492188.1 hypothetical protein [Yersinia enterocolitica]